MRTLKLTHEQIALIEEALNIAETQYFNANRQVRSISTRRNSYFINEIEKDNLDYLFHLSCLFADLSSDIKNSKLDV